MGNPEHPRSSLAIPTDEGHELIARAEGVIDHRPLDLLPGAGLDLDRSIPPLEVMGHLGIPRIGSGAEGRSSPSRSRRREKVVACLLAIQDR